MEDMVGKWKLDQRDSNFEDFLLCRGVGWFLRKMMTNGTAGVEYKLSDDKTCLTKVTTTRAGSQDYPMSTENNFMPKKTLSGRAEIGRLFETSGGNVVQEMRFEDTGDMAATVVHKAEDGKLNVTLKCGDVVCKSVYSKV